MTRETADALWGPDAVAHALREPDPEPVTDALLDEIDEHRHMPPGDFARWALSLPWPRFCALVRVVSGAERERLLEE